MVIQTSVRVSPTDGKSLLFNYKHMLIDFYGKECPHCVTMMPLVERLEKEAGLKVEKYEVWHNEENTKKMAEYDKGRCGGVPFFINTDTNVIICGEASYEELRNWAGAT